MTNECLATSRRGSVIWKKCEIFLFFFLDLNVSASCASGKQKAGKQCHDGAGGEFFSLTEWGIVLGKPWVNICYPPAFFADLNMQQSATQRAIWVKYCLFAQLHSIHLVKHKHSDTCWRMCLGSTVQNLNCFHASHSNILPPVVSLFVSSSSNLAWKHASSAYCFLHHAGHTRRTLYDLVS